MLNKKIIALIAAAALATCLALVGCASGGSSGSAASSSAASSSAASASAASASTSASSAAAPASSASTSASASAATPSASASSAAYIGEDAAKEIALKDAGLAAGDVTELKAELDLDDAVVHYDVDFKAGGMEYNYDVNATTGAIMESKSEVDD